MRLDNKVAIVTGAASGIGKEIAVLFGRPGARVAIADLNQHGAYAVADEFGGNKRAIGVAVDVTNEAQVDACVAKTVAAAGASASEKAELFGGTAARFYRLDI